MESAKAGVAATASTAPLARAALVCVALLAVALTVRPIDDFDVINRELALFDPAVAAKPQIAVANKIDAAPPGSFDALRRRFAARGIELWGISAATGAGVTELLREVARQVRAARQTRAADAPLSESGHG